MELMPICVECVDGCKKLPAATLGGSQRRRLAAVERLHASKGAPNVHPTKRGKLEPRADKHEAVEDLVRAADVVELAWAQALREARGVEEGAEDVGRAAGDDVVEAHHLASVGQAAGEDYVPDWHNGAEAERDEGQRAVPTVAAVVRREDDLGLARVEGREDKQE